MLPGETLASQCLSQHAKCEDCKVELIPKVLRSAAGFYVGTFCNCGPYSRESGYYKTKEAADQALADGSFERGVRG